MSNYKGLFTYDIDNHRYIPVEQADGIIDFMNYDPEPKELWSIDQFGEPINVTGLSRLQLEKLRRIGNLFGSEEKTKKAVEKLKAWERLKDKGFKFDGCGRYHWTGEEWPHIAFSYPNFGDLFDDSETVADLDFLFGGEK